MPKRRSVLRGAASFSILTALARPSRSQPADRPVKLVLNVGLQVLDPIAGPSFVTRNFSYMVFDTLVSMDSKGQYRPQMLEGWQVSADRLVWTFKLRPGLVFSDGAPVTAEDAVASLKRWGGRDNIGRRLIAATKDLHAVDTSTFVLELARPFGPVIEALGKPSVQVPFIMPARIASVTPPTTPVKEIVGSGPFLFIRELWIPGERAVFRRNPKYVPRDEPADGLAGGKVAKTEQVEFVNLADPGLRAAALQTGEVDYLEYGPIDYLTQFRKDPNLVVAQAGGIAQIMGAVSINHKQPPFDNVLMRRALQQALDRNEIVAAEGLPDDMSQPGCVSMFMCGGPYETTSGGDIIRDPSLEKARSLLKEAGYKGQPIVFLQPADSALINPLGLVVIERMRQAGFVLDVQTSDWSSIAQRWNANEPLDHGGWNLVPVIYTGFDMSDPLGNPGIGFNCSGNNTWGYCDAAMTPLIQQFEAESDMAKRHEIAGQLQRLSYQDVTFPITGEFRSPAVWRSNLKGVIDFGFPIMWNIERVAT
ncbi:MAG TPA: ABC transporter substrate-binding protein [Rhodopila sp.]